MHRTPHAQQNCTAYFHTHGLHAESSVPASIRTEAIRVLGQQTSRMHARAHGAVLACVYAARHAQGPRRVLRKQSYLLFDHVWSSKEQPCARSLLSLHVSWRVSAP